MGAKIKMHEKVITKPLAEMARGETGKVKEILQDNANKRLQDMGLSEGTKVTCVGESPLGDPKAFDIRGTVAAVRKKDAQAVIVETPPACKLAFAGNPNVGKSTLFNSITGMRQHTGNWPGKTVELAYGGCVYGGRKYEVADLPGCYSLKARSAEEEVAEAYIKDGMADVVAVVCDATCLERNLYLVLQILDMTKRVVVCVNLLDEAAKKKIRIDLPRLESLLGVPVAGMVARNKSGRKKLFEAIERLEAQQDTESEADKAQAQAIESSCREAEEETGQYPQKSGQKGYILRSEEICREVVACDSASPMERDRKWDRILTGKFTAVPVMLLLLMGIFWITITGANYPSAWLSKGLFFVEERLVELARGLGVPVFIYEMLIYGVYRVLAWVVSVMLPPMAIFFPLFTLLEDFGYLPRIAYNMDKCFQKCHACGKQALTMCMGFGCNAVGVTGCRIIDSPRERLVAILTNNFVPCNGRFPTLIVIITMFFAGGSAGGGAFASVLVMAAVIVLGIAVTFLISRLLTATVLKGMPSAFTLELPPYRRPQAGKVIVRSVLDRTLFVLGRAVAVAAPAGLIIWLLANIRIGGTALLYYCTAFLDPFARLLGMDGTILMAFVLGFPANEIVIPIIIMTYMSQGSLIDIGEANVLKQLLIANGWTWMTAVSTMLFSLMHWPCSTTLLTVKKETGSMKWTLAAFFVPALTGILFCFLFNTLMKIWI